MVLTVPREQLEKAIDKLNKSGSRLSIVIKNKKVTSLRSWIKDSMAKLCLGDFNGDEAVDASDLLDILGRFAALGTYAHGHTSGTGWHPQTPKYAKTSLEMCTGDLTLDQKLDTRDLLKLLQLYGSLFKKGTCGQPARALPAVPRPPACPSRQRPVGVCVRVFALTFSAWTLQVAVPTTPTTPKHTISAIKLRTKCCAVAETHSR